jgi:hypothetical protein
MKFIPILLVILAIFASTTNSAKLQPKQDDDPFINGTFPPNFMWGLGLF